MDTGQSRDGPVFNRCLFYPQTLWITAKRALHPQGSRPPNKPRGLHNLKSNGLSRFLKTVNLVKIEILVNVG